MDPLDMKLEAFLAIRTGGEILQTLETTSASPETKGAGFDGTAYEAVRIRFSEEIPLVDIREILTDYFFELGWITDIDIDSAGEWIAGDVLTDEEVLLSATAGYEFVPSGGNYFILNIQLVPSTLLE